MKLRQYLFVSLILGTCVAAAMAGGPVSPEGQVVTGPRPEIVVPAGKAFGDATDWYAATMAGADYLVGMQADITEDNAGNGGSDDDPDDGGWDWSSLIFSHGAGNSARNVYGVTALGLLGAYELDPDPTGSYAIAMKDAADGIIARNTDGDTGNDAVAGLDIVFLLEFADLGIAVDPAPYQQAAIDIWELRSDDHIQGDGTVDIDSFVNAVVNGRLPNLDNGIIPWDLSHWVRAWTTLDEVFPDYATTRDPIGFEHYAGTTVQRMYWEYEAGGAPMGLPSTFNPLDPAYYDEHLYTLGLASYVRCLALVDLGETPDPLVGAMAALMNCQMADGGFGYYQGNDENTNFSEWQTTAYTVMALHDAGYASPQPFAIREAASWIATTQDLTGAWLYSDDSHYPEVGAENVAALAIGWTTAGTAITASPAETEVGCDDSNLVTFSLDVNTGTPTITGVEVVLEIAADTTVPSIVSFTNAVAGAQFFGVTGTNPYSVNIAFYGGFGITGDTDLFTVYTEGFTEGDVTFTVLDYNMRDPDNIPVFADVTGTSFTVDCTPPLAVENIVATPGHQHVDVAWTHPDEDDLVGYEIFRGLWYWENEGTVTSTYPEYDDQAGATTPSRPDDHAAAVASSDWVSAGTVGAGTFTFEDKPSPDGLPRGVYYYEVFAVDAVDNGSDQAADGNDRATSYWLGDVFEPVDGNVDTDDIGYLATAFGSVDGGVGNFNASVDVGPTDTGSRLGTPMTDNVIDFEDLMIFALNFGVVSPSAKSEAPISPMAQLAWVEAGEGRYALRLVDGAGIKGVRVRASVPVGSVVAGDLLDRQDEMTFLRNIGSTLDVSVAVMGVGQGFEGTGDLLVVESTEAIAAGDLRLDVRGHDNSEVQVALDQTTGSVTPRAFELHANYPNPFNPMTKIAFSLPQSQPVKLAVYAVDGTLVRTLMNETREAGLHEVLWNGRNDAGRLMSSGTYFCRIEAGPYSQVRKMSLMK